MCWKTLCLPGKSSRQSCLFLLMRANCHMFAEGGNLCFGDKMNLERQGWEYVSCSWSCFERLCMPHRVTVFFKYTLNRVKLVEMLSTSKIIKKKKKLDKITLNMKGEPYHGESFTFKHNISGLWHLKISWKHPGRLFLVKSGNPEGGTLKNTEFYIFCRKVNKWI